MAKAPKRIVKSAPKPGANKKIAAKPSKGGKPASKKVGMYD